MSVYIVQTSESIKLKENVYKVGRTKQKGTKRMNGYPKGSELLLQEKVDNDVKMEKAILSVFNNKYKLREDYGKEYFEGDYADMRQTFRTIIDEVNNGTFVEPVKETREISEEDAAFIMKHIPRYIEKSKFKTFDEPYSIYRVREHYYFLNHDKQRMSSYCIFGGETEEKSIENVLYIDDNPIISIPRYKEISSKIKSFLNKKTFENINYNSDFLMRGRSNIIFISQLKLTPDMEKALNYFN